MLVITCGEELVQVTRGVEVATEGVVVTGGGLTGVVGVVVTVGVGGIGLVGVIGTGLLSCVVGVVVGI